MKHARSDYDIIQDCAAARQLAELVLDMDMVTEKGQAARKLARMVLGLDEVLSPDTVLISTNGTMRMTPKDEPVFLIRGQDAVGADTVRDWANRAEAIGADLVILQTARDDAAKMATWPRKQIPDTPK